VFIAAQHPEREALISGIESNAATTECQTLLVISLLVGEFRQPLQCSQIRIEEFSPAFFDLIGEHIDIRQIGSAVQVAGVAIDRHGCRQVAVVFGLFGNADGMLE
jgi:hypothetical protein